MRLLVARNAVRLHTTSRCSPIPSQPIAAPNVSAWGAAWRGANGVRASSRTVPTTSHPNAALSTGTFSSGSSQRQARCPRRPERSSSPPASRANPIGGSPPTPATRCAMAVARGALLRTLFPRSRPAGAGGSGRFRFARCCGMVVSRHAGGAIGGAQPDRHVRQPFRPRQSLRRADRGSGNPAAPLRPARPDSFRHQKGLAAEACIGSLRTGERGVRA